MFRLEGLWSLEYSEMWPKNTILGMHFEIYTQKTIMQTIYFTIFDF